TSPSMVRGLPEPSWMAKPKKENGSTTSIKGTKPKRQKRKTSCKRSKIIIFPYCPLRQASICSSTGTSKRVSRGCYFHNSSARAATLLPLGRALFASISACKRPIHTHCNHSENPMVSTQKGSVLMKASGAGGLVAHKSHSCIALCKRCKRACSCCA